MKSRVQLNYLLSCLICNLAFKRDFCSVTCLFGYIVATDFAVILTYYNILCLFVIFACKIESEFRLFLLVSVLKQNDTWTLVNIECMSSCLI